MDEIERVAKQIHDARPVTVENQPLDWDHVVRNHSGRANVYRHEARKQILREELIRRAQFARTITYGEAASMVGLASQGLGKILTEMGAEEASQGKPDLACLVVKASTGFPGYIGDGESERSSALALRAEVFRIFGVVR